MDRIQLKTHNTACFVNKNPQSVLSTMQRAGQETLLSHSYTRAKRILFFFCYSSACSRGPEQDGFMIGGAPESLTFKERQRLFSQGKEVSNKVKASRKLMELENELNTKQ